MGEYIDDLGHCLRCEASCSTCRGPTQENCTSCPITRFFDNGRCVLTCPSGKFEFQNQCHPCHHTCQECQGNEPSNCTSCGTDKFGKERFLYMGKCQEGCPSGYHHSDNTCLPCTENCQLCSNSSYCIRCLQGYYILPTNNTCQKLECKEGEVKDPDYEDCMPCEEGCLGCSLSPTPVSLPSFLSSFSWNILGTSFSTQFKNHLLHEDDPGICTSCATGYYLFKQRCYKTCPEKTYSENFECRECSKYCGDCDQHECYWCEEGFYLFGGICVRECGPGFYSDTENGECEPCHQTCKTCTGLGCDKCSSCKGDLQLVDGKCVDPSKTPGQDTFGSDDEMKPGARRQRRLDSPSNLIKHQLCDPSCKTCNGSAILCTSCPKGTYLFSQSCIPSCPQGTWSSEKSGRCEKCMEDCEYCSTANNCIKCLSQPDHPLYLHHGRCYTHCPERFYAENGTCKACDLICKTCEGNATNCHSCKKDLVLAQGTCQKSCPERYITVDGTCKHCPEMCQECIHEKTCKECVFPFLLHDEICLRDCPPGFYEDFSKCSPCSESCLECNGPDDVDCKVCRGSLVFHNGQCLEACPDGTYYEKASKRCKGCPENCKTCSPWACISCKEGMSMTWLRSCVATKECTASEYKDEKTQDCKPCHMKCFHCSGPAEDECLSCPNNSLLLNTTCVEKCPDGYYSDTENQHCSPCHNSCETCEGKHSTQCQSCHPGWFRLENKCLLQCEEGYYPDNSSRLCEKCHQDCRECRGPHSTDCLSCHKYFFLLHSKGECHRTCPEHHYVENRTQTCERCYPTCNECKGKGPLNCLSCMWNYHLLGGICSSDCLTGEYRVGEGENFECDNCHESCIECKGPGPQNCTVCPTNMMLYIEDGRCIPCCSSSNSTDVQDCCDCHETTEECNFRAGVIKSKTENTKRTGLLITFSIMPILLFGVTVCVWRRSKAKSQKTHKAGYEKLSEKNTTFSSYKSSYRESTNFQEDQVIEYRDRDYDEDEDDDIVYMGQDGTFYRKFKYGLLHDDDEDELEYDDESYSFK